MKRQAPVETADVCDCNKVRGEKKYAVKRTKSADFSEGYTTLLQDGELLEASKLRSASLKQVHALEVEGLHSRYQSKIKSINQAHEGFIEKFKEAGAAEIEANTTECQEIFDRAFQAEQAAKEHAQAQVEELQAQVESAVPDAQQCKREYRSELQRFNAEKAEKDSAAKQLKAKFEAEKQRLNAIIAAKDEEVKQSQQRAE